MSDNAFVLQFSELVASFKSRVIAAIPHLVFCLVVVAAGLIVAFLLRAGIRRLVKGLSRLLPARDGRGVEAQDLNSAADWIAGIGFWIVLLFFLTIATEILGLTVLTTWLGGLTTYLPRVLAAVLIGFIGYFVARAGRDLIVRTTASAGFVYSDALGKATQSTILLVTLIVAIRQLGIEIQFLTASLLILLSSLLAGGALAFGLGAKNIMSNILSSYYLQKSYRVGQQIRIGAAEGKILQITPTSVILETEEGRLMIPAKRFSDFTSLALDARA